jgi:hypothetical protein
VRTYQERSRIKPSRKVGRLLGPCGPGNGGGNGGNGGNGGGPSGDTIVYNLLTNRNVYQIATLSAPSAAGQHTYDPIFGTKITRMSDANTNNAAKQDNGWVCVDSSSAKNTWSSDGQYYAINLGLGVFDANTGQFAGSFPGGFNPQWSFQRPGIAYGTGGSPFGIAEHNFNTSQTTTLFAYNRLASQWGYSGVVQNDWHDRRLAVYTNGLSQDEYRLLIVYDKQTDTYMTWDLDAGTMGAPGSSTRFADQNGPFSVPYGGFHSIEMERSGRFLNITLIASAVYDMGVTTDIGAYLWDMQNNTAFRIWCANNTQLWNYIPPAAAGHTAWGFSEWVNDSGTQVPTWLPTGYSWRPINFSALGPPGNQIQLMQPPPSMTPDDGGWAYRDSHINWASVKPDQRNPFYVSRYLDPAKPNQVWDNEIILIDVDSRTIFRAGHHRCSYDVVNQNFWTAPHGSMSPLGNRCVYSSNWNWDLGRMDVFMMDLPIVT